MERLARVTAAIFGLALAGCAPEVKPFGFRKHVVTAEFLSEGIAVADLNRDGSLDLVTGAYWWPGPEFKEKRAFRSPPAKPYTTTDYSDTFLAFAADVDQDGATDIVQVGLPGGPTVWYRNPGRGEGLWIRNLLLAETSNESPAWADLDRDGQSELVCFSRGAAGYATLDPSEPTGPAIFTAITTVDEKRFPRYAHGLGVGDLSGDRWPDILCRDGWWENPRGGPWRFHRVAFAPDGQRGGAQMLVADVDGDGLNDVITSADAHGYGLGWYRQTSKAAFEFRPIDGPKVSQLHALAAGDFNQDGLPDFVTGKRFNAHAPGVDPGSDEPAMLVVYLLRRVGGKATYEAHVVDENSGVGTQVVVADVDRDGRDDIVVSCKKGVFVFYRN